MNDGKAKPRRLDYMHEGNPEEILNLEQLQYNEDATRYRAQLDKADEQMARQDRQSDRTDRQAEQFDRILAKWEEQQKRLDALLDRLERGQ